ncbi:MAG: hypothetical protein QOI38_986 [Sphingomonadales bacterium]|jgi:hypothetical protein|nr:hypothetical protein [Sphingomonadales bacterium]
MAPHRRRCHLRDMKAALALLLALSACAPSDPRQRAQDAARRVADSYMEERGWDGRRHPGPVTVEEDGPHWIVSYRLPEGSAGGESYVWVDRNSMRAVDFIGTQ